VNEFGIAKVSAARSSGFRDPLEIWLGVEAVKSGWETKYPNTLKNKPAADREPMIEP
jgi:hypothetical protein